VLKSFVNNRLFRFFFTVANNISGQILRDWPVYEPRQRNQAVSTIHLFGPPAPSARSGKSGDRAEPKWRTPCRRFRDTRWRHLQQSQPNLYQINKDPCMKSAESRQCWRPTPSISDRLHGSASYIWLHFNRANFRYRYTWMLLHRWFSAIHHTPLTR